MLTTPPVWSLDTFATMLGRVFGRAGSARITLVPGLRVWLHTSPLRTSKSTQRSGRKNSTQLLDDLFRSRSEPKKNADHTPIVDRRNRGYPALASSAKWDAVKTQEKKLSKDIDPIYTWKDVPVSSEVQPGDFVEARKSTITYVGVILPIPEDKEVSGAGQGASHIMVLATGQIEQIRATDVMFQVPNFVDASVAEAAAPLKWDYVLATATHTRSALVSSDKPTLDSEPFVQEEPVDLPRFSARAVICRKIRDMQLRMDRETRRVYPTFRTLFLQDPSSYDTTDTCTTHDTCKQEIRQLALAAMKSGMIGTLTATKLVEQYIAENTQLADVRVSTLFAIHTLLMSHPVQFLADAISHRRSQHFTYRPAQDQKIIERVSGWVRVLTSERPNELADEAEQVLNGFCSRARHVMAWHDERPLKADALPEPDERVPGLDGASEFIWSDTDKEILEFFKISLGNRRELQENVTGSIAMDIIKRLGVNVRLHPIVVSADSEQNEGIMAHDQRAKNISTLHTDVTQAGFDLQHSQMFNFLIRVGALTPWENPNALDTQLKNLRALPSCKTEGVDLHDEHEPRFCFDNLPVYVIDSASSFELDDGISVEATEDPAMYWIHVHIADPTAWLRPEHALSQTARHKYSSVYFPEIMLPMLPTDVTNHKMSLSSKNTPLNVLTFSALVDSSSGKVSSYDVRRGKIGNIRILNYNQVNEMFLDREDIGRHKVSDATAQDDLHLLASLASVINRRRVHIGRALNAVDAHSDLSIYPLPLPILADKTLDRPQFYTGFPEIRLRFADHTNTERLGTFDQIPGGITSETMVSEMMILAGRVAGSFGLDHNIPLPYRVQPEPSDTELAIIDELKNPETGAMAMSKLISKDVFLPTGNSSIKPGIHYALGVRPMPQNDINSDAFYRGGYVRVTSPLRRFADLACHWQLKAELSGENHPFNFETMSLLLVQFDQMDNWVKQIERASSRYWLWVYINRTLSKKQNYDFEGRSDYTTFFTPEEQALLEPIPAIQNIMDVRFNSETLQSTVRISLPQLGGLPVDCEWPNGKTPPRKDEIKRVKINRAESAGLKRTIVCRQVK